MAILRVIRGPNAEEMFELKPGTTTLGRDGTCCDFPLLHHAVSRQHAAIELTDDGAFIQDLGSRNGTTVNGDILTSGPNGQRRLEHNDWIEITEFCLTYEDDPSIDSKLKVTHDTTAAVPHVESEVDVDSNSSFLHRTKHSAAKLQAALTFIDELAGVAELKHICPKILDCLFRSFPHTQYGFILLRDESSGEFVTTAVKSQEEPVPSGKTIRVSQTIIQYVAAGKKAILSTDAAMDDRFADSKSVRNLEMRSMMSAPIFDNDGETIGIVQLEVLQHDHQFTKDELDVYAGLVHHTSKAIENSKLHDSALRRQKLNERRLRTMIDYAPEAIVVLDTDTNKFTDANENAVQLYGMSREELLNVGPVETSPPTQPSGLESVEAIRQRVAEAMRGEAPVFEWTHCNSKGDLIPCEVRFVRLPGTHEHLVRGSITDITDRKQAEEALLHAYDELEDRVAQRTAELARSNKDLEQFAYIVSHDLQEPLRSVAGFCDLLRRRYKGQLDEKGSEFLDYAVDASQRMQELISDLLNYSRVATRPRKPIEIDCGEIVETALVNLNAAIEEAGAEITTEELPKVVGDRTQLLQLFQNLIANAVRFRADRPVKVNVKSVDNGDAYQFEVEDNGIGISTEHKDRIFMIFQQLDGSDEHPGTGIGLAIAKRVVEQHGGRIWVDSVLGEGSIFRFTLTKTSET